AHLFIFYFGVLSFITPPVCTATYVAAGIAGAGPMRTAWVGIRLGIAAYIVPFIFAFAPTLLLIGSWTDIVIRVILSIIGIIFVAVAVEGYLFSKLNIPERIWGAIGALVMIIPVQMWTIVGLGITIAFLLYEWIKTKSRIKNRNATGLSTKESDTY
ncbi:MAG: TRAP transporter large permease subunit, partial [Dehalococcoidia bacterium]|nr:TRAP transporter large permease subunit [Dehalococcoidia bacterium]